jgi:hypothetical protein
MVPVLKALEEFLPGVSKAVPQDQLTLASVQRIVQLWYHRSGVQKDDKEAFPSMVRTRVTQTRLSKSAARSNAASSASGVQEEDLPTATKPAPKVNQKSTLAEFLKDLEDEDEESDVASTRKVAKPVLRHDLVAMDRKAPAGRCPRVFDDLDSGEDTCQLEEEQLLKVETWFRLNLDARSVFQQLKDHFTDFRVTEGNYRVMAEIKGYWKQQPRLLKTAIDNVYRTQALAQRNGEKDYQKLFKVAAKEMDQLLIELTRKKVLATRGAKKANQFAEKIKTYHKDTTDWLVARALVMSDAKDFRNSPPEGATGNDGEAHL